MVVDIYFATVDSKTHIFRFLFLNSPKLAGSGFQTFAWPSRTIFLILREPAVQLGFVTTFLTISSTFSFPFIPERT